VPSRKLLAALISLSLSPWSRAGQPLSLDQYVQQLAPVKADARVAYGSGTSQWADLYLPKGTGPFPVVVLVHGGCWSAEVGAESESQVAADLAAHGVAVWNIEYRRLGETGGGYPNMYLDVGAAFDKLRGEAGARSLDAAHVVAVGHSSGGHLALWAASRAKLPAGSALRTASPLPVAAVVSIAGAGDLKGLASVLPIACGDETKMDDVVGKATPQRPDPFADTSPRALLPTGVRTLSINGVYDDILPPYTALWWRMAAAKSGDPADNAVLPDAGHFDVVAVQTPTWPAVRERILAEVAFARR
jgi:acetyl esterase/lipase